MHWGWIEAGKGKLQRRNIFRRQWMCRRSGLSWKTMQLLGILQLLLLQRLILDPPLFYNILICKLILYSAHTTLFLKGEAAVLDSWDVWDLSSTFPVKGRTNQGKRTSHFVHCTWYWWKVLLCCQHLREVLHHRRNIAQKQQNKLYNEKASWQYATVTTTVHL